MRNTHERGIALITTLLVMMLMSALLLGFTAVVMSDQRFRFIDHDRGQSFYAASGGVEKLTADLGNVFFTNVAPKGSQITALTDSTKKPTISGVTFTGAVAPAVLATSSLNQCATASQRTVGATGYTISYCAAASGDPTNIGTAKPIKSGPYAGLLALETPYQLDVTAKTATGGETHLVRAIESVAIPVFQFGMFSDVDLAFFAGPDFAFGGRVHTNGNLFLAEGSGTLTLSDKVTAVKEVIRQQLQNGVSIDTSGHTSTVSMAKAPSVFRNLARTEGSVTAGPTSSQNEPTWHTVSISTYNSWIRNGRTGATTLKLPLITAGGSNPDLVRRPVVGEDSANPILYGERLYTKASIRILLSDTATDITALPGVTSTTPVQLDGNWYATVPNNGTAYGPLDAAHPPIARTAGLTSAAVTSSVSTGTGKTITFASLPTAWRMPTTLNMKKTTATAATYTLSCTGKDATHLYACTGSYPSLTVSSAVPKVDGTITTLDSRSLTLPTLVMTSNVSAGTSASTVTATAADTMPYSVNTFWANGDLITCSGYLTNTQLTGCNVPVALAVGDTVSNAAASSSGTGMIGGYLKIEKQDSAGAWTDITMEILNYGIGGPNIVNGSGGANAGGTACTDPTPTAILRMQRLKDNNWSTCEYAATANTPSTDYWPNSLFDTREAVQRDTAASNILLGGVMYYISLDVANLSKWFTAQTPYAAGTGSTARTDNGGFTVYFSDRRNNRNSAGYETGEYGWEDFVNPAASDGAPNGSLDTGEDVNGNNTLDVYGGVPNYNGTYNTVPPGASFPLTASATPRTPLNRGQAQVNRSILFRHALKLINGSSIRSLGVTGLSVVSENPVYVQGNWNASGSFSGAHAATSVIADAVTLLSNGWNDNRSFSSPYVFNGTSPANRERGSDSWYRLAIVAGKGMAFPWPSGTATDFGTDGGAHNFLRYLEDGDAAVNYQGSIATFFYNRQAVGTYKCCTTVYGAPTRNYAFDTDFLNPALLPPNTPVFRDLNTIGFAQEIRPGR
jgi:Tfp pilus assembly protein PilX